MLNLGLPVLPAAALGRGIEVIGDGFPSGHASVTMTFTIRKSGCLRL
jgi:hypothetical protein